MIGRKAALWFALAPSAAVACSCMGVRPPCAGLASAKAVFVGRVESIRTVETGPSNAVFRNRHDVVFAITEWFQGPAGPQLIVSTGSGGGDCGFEFAVGKT